MKNSNKYTLITGSSDGFGKALAIECARRGMNLILVALPGPELRQVAAFIKKNFFVDVKTFAKDLTNERDCFDLYSEIIDLNLSVNILINNAGIGSLQYFTDTSPAFFKKQITLNVFATTLLTSLFVPELRKTAPSHVLNVSSLSSFFYLPKKQVYGATKSFIYYFSKALRYELRKDQVVVSVVCPGGMNTNINASLINRTGSLLSRLSILNPEQVAPFVVKKMLKGKEVIIPGILNRFSMFLKRLMPAFVKRRIANKLMEELRPSPQLQIISSSSSPLAA